MQRPQYRQNTDGEMQKPAEAEIAAQAVDGRAGSSLRHHSRHNAAITGSHNAEKETGLNERGPDSFSSGDLAPTVIRQICSQKRFLIAFLNRQTTCDCYEINYCDFRLLDAVSIYVGAGANTSRPSIPWCLW